MKLCQFSYRNPVLGVGFCPTEAVEGENYCEYHLEQLADDQDPWGGDDAVGVQTVYALLDILEAAHDNHPDSHAAIIDNRLMPLIEDMLAGAREDGRLFAMREIYSDCAVEWQDERLSYVTVQMGWETWRDLEDAREGAAQ